MKLSKEREIEYPSGGVFERRLEKMTVNELILSLNVAFHNCWYF